MVSFLDWQDLNKILNIASRQDPHDSSTSYKVFHPNYRPPLWDLSMFIPTRMGSPHYTHCSLPTFYKSVFHVITLTDAHEHCRHLSEFVSYPQVDFTKALMSQLMIYIVNTLICRNITILNTTQIRCCNIHVARHSTYY